MADNYQLKWHSHGSHLHSCVSTLYRSDTFTDVTLVTTDGRFLAAHRFVLSACSSYLSAILQITTPSSTPNPNIVIVLPPEITYKTLSILLQYMYSGEATVSNDQLNGVLKAGKILRIKGLCREKECSNEHVPLLQEAQFDRSNVDSRLPVHSRGTNPTSRHPERSHSSASSANEGSVHSIPSSSKKSNHTHKSNGSDKVTDNRSQDSRSQTPRTDKVSIDKITGEINIEDNMKIELLVKEEPLDWNDNEDTTTSQDEAEVRIKAVSFREFIHNIT